jgi:hypothetical protein
VPALEVEPAVEPEVDVRTPPAAPVAEVTADATGDAAAVPAEAAAAVPAHAVAAVGATAWSIDALADLGLAPLVLERVAAHAPRADLEWVAALAAAIEEVAAAIDPHGSNVELTGHGRHAAVDLIGGLCRGMRVGHLVIDGIRVEATPVELALGVRACLQG